MIVSGYSIDLYCDCVDCFNSPSQKEATYHGETYGECAKKARHDGWRLSRDRRYALSPGCKKVKHPDTEL
jgi:hypothetical protein